MKPKLDRFSKQLNKELNIYASTGGRSISEGVPFGEALIDHVSRQGLPEDSRRQLLRVEAQSARLRALVMKAMRKEPLTSNEVADVIEQHVSLAGEFIGKDSLIVGRATNGLYQLLEQDEPPDFVRVKLHDDMINVLDAARKKILGPRYKPYRERLDDLLDAAAPAFSRK